MASKEIKAAGAGNAGIQDQRQAMRWVQKYISKFGGDPMKVTIFGESAGAISGETSCQRNVKFTPEFFVLCSVALHMIANNGNNEGLFRGAFMQSGSPIPVADIINGQQYYDTIVKQTGCSGNLDTLACLKGLPLFILQDAINKSPFLLEYQVCSSSLIHSA